MKKLFLLQLFCVLYFNCFSQAYPPPKEMFVQVVPSPVNPSTKAGWNLVSSDEFTGSTLNSKWSRLGLPLCYGNTDVPEMDMCYNDNGTGTHNGTGLSATPNLTVSSGNATIRVDYDPSGLNVSNCFDPYCIYKKPYRAATLSSANCANGASDDTQSEVTDHSWTYGYFEVRCKIPKMQYGWSGAVLYGANANGVTEIDLVELFGNSKYLVCTNHVPDGTAYGFAKWVYSMPNQSFSDDYVTYAVRWEPKRIIHYINNIPIKVFKVKNGLDSIPQTPMRLYTGPKIGKHYLNSNIQTSFPQTTYIDYVRVYQRPNPTGTFLDFTINGQKNSTSTSHLSIPFLANKPVILNALESYDPNEYWALSIIPVDASGNAIGSEYWRNLTSAEKASIDNIDITAFAASMGLTLTQGSHYFVKLISTSPWVEKAEWIYLNSCTNNIAFSINGQGNTTFPAPVTAGYDIYAPDYIMNASATNACRNQYYVSIQRCDASGNYNGYSEFGNWLTSTQVAQLSSFDLAAFYNSFNPGNPNNKFVYGAYYRIKLAVPNETLGGPWLEKVQMLYVQPCTNTISFKINGDQASSTYTVAPGDEIMLDASASKLCDANSMTISISECDASGNNCTVNTVSEVDDDRYLSSFDIRDFCGRKNFTLTCNKTYLITLQTASASMSRKIYISSCTPDNSYTIDNNPASVVEVNENQINAESWILIHSTSTTRSCNDMYFVSIQKLDNNTELPVGTEISKWLSQEEVRMFKNQGFSMSNLWNQANPSDKIPPSATACQKYRIRLVPGYLSCGGTDWLPNDKILKFKDPTVCGSSFKPLPTGLNENGEGSGISIYPNPNTGSFNIVSGAESESLDVTITDITGKMVYQRAIVTTNFIANLEINAGKGIYLVTVKNKNNETFNKKLIITD